MHIRIGTCGECRTLQCILNYAGVKKRGILYCGKAIWKLPLHKISGENVHANPEENAAITAHLRCRISIYKFFLARLPAVCAVASQICQKNKTLQNGGFI